MLSWISIEGLSFNVGCFGNVIGKGKVEVDDYERS